MAVVVLDEQDVRALGEERAKRRGTLAADGRARGVLRPVGDHDRPRALLDDACQLLGQRPLVVDTDRCGAQSESRNEVQQAAPPGILHGHDIAGP